MAICITKEEAEARGKRIKGIIQLMPKIDQAKEIIQEALFKHKNPVVSFSGGKDSLVVLDLVRSIRPDVIALFADTGNEYMETVPYVQSFENVIIVKPEMPVKQKDGTTKIVRGNKVFWACVEKYGLPEIKSKARNHGNTCCFWLKKRPLTTWQKEHEVGVVITGLTSAESRQRKLTLKRMGHYYYHKRDEVWMCHPIHDWTDQDVWDYIRLKELKYNPAYDLDIPRIGCRFCTAYKGWEKTTAKYNEKDTQILARKQGNRLLKDFL